MNYREHELLTDPFSSRGIDAVMPFLQLEDLLPSRQKNY